MAKDKEAKKGADKPGTEDDKKKGRARPDGRRQVLLYMEAPIIKALKALAIEEDTTAYELAEEAIKGLLKARRAGKKS